MGGEIRMLRQRLQEDRAAGAGDAADVDRLRYPDGIEVVCDNPASRLPRAIQRAGAG